MMETFAELIKILESLAGPYETGRYSNGESTNENIFLLPIFLLELQFPCEFRGNSGTDGTPIVSNGQANICYHIFFFHATIHANL